MTQGIIFSCLKSEYCHNADSSLDVESGLAVIPHVRDPFSHLACALRPFCDAHVLLSNELLQDNGKQEDQFF